MPDLTPKQEEAISKVVKWINAWRSEYNEDIPQVFQFTGYAGTGKTTCIKEFVNRFEMEACYAAYTGKAALVMKQINDVPASTIHSLIYEYIKPDRAACEDLFNQLQDPDNELSVDEKVEMQTELDDLSKPRFQINVNSALFKADILILDECSMVNMELLDDLMNFEKPILALGDPGQLPPIDGAGALFIGEPQVKLTEIHRQAADNPIIIKSTQARMGVPWAYSEHYDLEQKFLHLPKRVITDAIYQEICMAGDQIITGKNATRYYVNSKMRKWLDFDWQNPFPQVGESLCCWKNDKEKNLYNGLMARVEQVGDLFDEYIELFIRTELMSDDQEPLRVRALRAYFENYFDPEAMKRVKWWQRKNNQEFDFGYCITVHKAQGSQWDKVTFLDDGLFKGWKAKERKQFVYTATTRAINNLYVIS